MRRGGPGLTTKVGFDLGADRRQVGAALRLIADQRHDFAHVAHGLGARCSDSLADQGVQFRFAQRRRQIGLNQFDLERLLSGQVGAATAARSR